MGTKIQINSLEALERLIGNDNELEMEIRNSIVQEFTKKHLKSLVNETSLTKTVSDIKIELDKIVSKKTDEAIGEVKRRYEGGPIDWIELKPEIKSKIERLIQNMVSEIIDNTVNKYVTTWLTEENLNRILDTKINYNIDVMVNRAIQKQLEAVRNKLIS